MDEELVRRAIIERVKKGIEKINSHLPDDLALCKGELVVEFTLKGRCAGKGGRRNGKGWMNFNMYLACKNFDTFMEEVVDHELAHVYQFKNHRDAKAHGYWWRHYSTLIGNENIKMYHRMKTQKCGAREI